MAIKRRRLLARLSPWLIVFVAGVGVGYYARDQRQDEKLREAAERARQEMEQVGLDAIERAQSAGEGLRAGAQAAAESTKAAFRELVESKSR